MLLLSHQTAVEQHRLLLQGTGTDSDPVPELSWASPVLGWQRQRPRRTCVKPPLQLHLPLPHEGFVLSARGTRVAYTKAVQSPGQGNALQTPGEKHKSPCPYQKPATSPNAPSPAFPRTQGKKQIKATEQHSEAVGGSCSPQRNTGFWGTVGFRKRQRCQRLCRAPSSRQQPKPLSEHPVPGYLLGMK